MSVSFLRTPSAAKTVNCKSSWVVFVSATKSGASLTGVTVIIKVVFEVSTPSETVYVTVGTVPLKSLAGVNT